MQFSTTYKTQKISAKKLRFILDAVKKLKPLDAVTRLQVSPLKASAILRKAILNSLHNATQNLKVASNELRFTKINVDDGPFFKRMRPGPKGMANFYKKRTSHVTIVYNTITKVEKAMPTSTESNSSVKSQKSTKAIDSSKKTSSNEVKTVKKTSPKKVSKENSTK